MMVMMMQWISNSRFATKDSGSSFEIDSDDIPVPDEDEAKGTSPTTTMDVASEMGHSTISSNEEWRVPSVDSVHLLESYSLPF